MKARMLKAHITMTITVCIVYTGIGAKGPKLFVLCLFVGFQ